jgi:hypothetical protein
MQIKCAACGSSELESGFALDAMGGTRGIFAWVEGTLERGFLGGVKQVTTGPRYAVEAYRCKQCLFLNQYAREML